MPNSAREYAFVKCLLFAFTDVGLTVQSRVFWHTSAPGWCYLHNIHGFYEWWYLLAGDRFRNGDGQHLWCVADHLVDGQWACGAAHASMATRRHRTRIERIISIGTKYGIFFAPLSMCTFIYVTTIMCTLNMLGRLCRGVVSRCPLRVGRLRSRNRDHCGSVGEKWICCFA